MSSLRHFVVVVVFGLLSEAAFAQSPVQMQLAPAKAMAVDKTVEAQMQKQGLIGVAVGIIREGQIVYLKGYGQSNREQSSPVTEQTIFNWASNSKPVAAVAALQLTEKKLLDLDADVRRYVPEFPDKGDVITTRQLLCHQSGIPHYSNGTIVPTEGKYSLPRPFLDPVVALDKFNQSPLVFKPGEKMEYSSYGYMLVSAVIQRAGKKPFQAQIEERIVRPLGMKSFQLDMEFEHQPHWAVGYTKDKQGNIVPAKEVAHYWKHGAGGFKSNIQDFAVWAQALINRRLLSQESEKQMWTAQTTSKGEKTTRGLGMSIGEPGEWKVSHNGIQEDAMSRLVLYPRAKHGIVIMCNCRFADVGAITTAIFEALNQK
jgi:CubicO group peptidase (beta-lactamase class C family)